VDTSIGIVIAAPPRRVFDLARDVARWPALLPHYRRVTVHAERDGRIVAQMVAVRAIGRLGIPVTWRAEQWADDSDPDDLRLEFRHVRGATRGMEVTWHIRPVAGGTSVTIEHRFTRALPLVGDALFPRFVDRFFVASIAGRTLRRFRDLAEADTSSGAPAANRPA
jgi:aromatase